MKRRMAMRFTVERKTFLESINNISRVVPQRSTIPCLEGIKFYIDGGKLEITGYDMELGLQNVIEAESEDHGEFILNARIFCSIVGKLDSDKITVEVDSNLKTTITGGNAIYNIPAMSADEYPSLPDIDRSDSFAVPQAVLKSMISQTSYAVSQLDSKPILKGELFEIQDKVFNMVAIDGFRLAIRKEAIDTEDVFNFVIKSRSLLEAEKLLKDDNDATVNVYVTKKFTAFEMNGYTLITRVLEGEFHNYKGSIPKSCDTEVIINVNSFVYILDRCMLLIDEHTKAPVRCLFEDGKLKVTTSTSQGNFYDEMNVEMSGNRVEIGFNCKYLLEALKHSGCDEVKLQMGSPTSPMKMVPLSGDSFTFLVLPVRLK